MMNKGKNFKNFSLKEGVTEKENQRKKDLLSISSFIKSQVSASSKPTTNNPILVSDMGSKDPHSWMFFNPFPVILAGDWMGRGAARFKLDVGVRNESLTHSTLTTVPKWQILNRADQLYYFLPLTSTCNLAV